MKSKVVFYPISLEENINIVKWTFNESEEFHNYTLGLFKELSDKSTDKEIEEVVTRYYNNRIDEINKNVIYYNEVWNNYNDSFFKELTTFLNTDFNDEIKGYIGVIPVYPRYLSDKSFFIGNNLDEGEIVRVTAHETCHFIWFKKWQELFPDSNPDDFESPHKIWEYSEIIIDPILNNKKINEVIRVYENTYDYFYDLQDKNGLFILDELHNIFNSNESIEEKIKKGYKYFTGE